MEIFCQKRRKCTDNYGQLLVYNLLDMRVMRCFIQREAHGAEPASCWTETLRLIAREGRNAAPAQPIMGEVYWPRNYYLLYNCIELISDPIVEPFPQKRLVFLVP